MTFLETLWARQLKTVRTSARFHAERLPQHAETIQQQADEYCDLPVPTDNLKLDLYRLEAERLSNSWKRLGPV